jgi:uncharacterized membrane protein YedE/YeeE
MSTFTPYTALIGGALIGLATVTLLWFNGRIAGVSGIVNGLLTRESGDVAWRGWFVFGLVVGAGSYNWLIPLPFEPRADYPYFLTVVAGLLVGFGTRMGGGCTSGHGVCGLARLSLRSLIATGVFLTTGAITVFVTRHLGGL